MDSTTSHSKILTIINEDYMKMMSKENDSKTPSTIGPQPTTVINRKPPPPRLSNVATFLTRNITKTQKPPTIRGRWKTAARRINADDVLWWNPPDKSLTFTFCSDTSLHGLKYIGQKDRHISERIFWGVAFLVGLIVAVILISDVWKKYRNSPIIVSFDPTQITVDQVPFPAVTICNMNKILKSKAQEYIDRLKTDTSNEAKADVYYLDHVCSATKSFTKQFNITRSGDLAEMVAQDVKKMLVENPDLGKNLTRVNAFLRKASQNCSDMIPLCVWQDREMENCSLLFRPIETEFGKCCTFNMIPQTELWKQRNDSRDDEHEINEWRLWNTDSSSVDVLLKDYKGTYPRRQMEAGKSFGLSVLLNPRMDEYYCTTSDSLGFQLSTHWPADVPHVTDFGISIRAQSEVFVNVKPEISLVDTSVFKFDLDDRHCYKVGEFPLEYYNYYTIRNCVDECIANETIKRCGCKRYFMPRGNDETLCGGDFDCAEIVKLNMTKFGAKSECKMCLPSCSEIQFYSQTTTTPLQMGTWQLADGRIYELQPDHNVTIAHIFFGQDSSYARVRNELFGTTDLFANTGGLMGLCLGFSGLSLMEVIYFFTLRAWWASKRKEGVHKSIGRKLQSGWGKVKALALFRNGPAASLNKQVKKQEVEKVMDDSCQLHVSPAYTKNLKVGSPKVHVVGPTLIKENKAKEMKEEKTFPERMRLTPLLMSSQLTKSSVDKPVTPPSIKPITPPVTEVKPQSPDFSSKPATPAPLLPQIPLSPEPERLKTQSTFMPLTPPTPPPKISTSTVKLWHKAFGSVTVTQPATVVSFPPPAPLSPEPERLKTQSTSMPPTPLTTPAPPPTKIPTSSVKLWKVSFGSVTQPGLVTHPATPPTELPPTPLSPEPERLKTQSTSMPSSPVPQPTPPPPKIPTSSVKLWKAAFGPVSHSTAPPEKPWEVDLGSAKTKPNVYVSDYPAILDYKNILGEI